MRGFAEKRSGALAMRSLFVLLLVGTLLPHWHFSDHPPHQDPAGVVHGAESHPTAPAHIEQFALDVHDDCFLCPYQPLEPATQSNSIFLTAATTRLQTVRSTWLSDAPLGAAEPRGPPPA